MLSALLLKNIPLKLWNYRGQKLPKWQSDLLLIADYWHSWVPFENTLIKSFLFSQAEQRWQSIQN